MKKHLVIAAAALLIGSAANAQDVYKQQGGEHNLEVQFSPLADNPISTLGIRYRQFTGATTAFRAQVDLGFNSMTAIDIDNSGEAPVELRTVDSRFNVAISGGIERHFAGTDRLSPYYGFIATVGFSREATREDQSAEVEQTTRSSAFDFGAGAVAGVDFYFADNIYLGTELNFIAKFTNFGDIVVESNATGSETQETPQGSSFSVQPGVIGAIRVGFLF